MVPVIQLSIVLFLTVLALKKLPASWEALLQLGLQMVLEHGLTGRRWMILQLHGDSDSGKEPEPIQTKDHQSADNFREQCQYSEL